MLWVIRVDGDPMPWEDWSFSYAVFDGTKVEVEAYESTIQKEHPNWLVMAEEVKIDGVQRGVIK